MSEPQKPQPPEGSPEELVAYLDGELDAESSRRVERLLAVQPAVRDELQRLERSWDLLDQLPRAQVGPLFTQTTVGMVALEVERDLQEKAPRRSSRKVPRWLAPAAGLAVAATVGFLAVSAFMPDPNEQLLTDLPVLERLDDYSQARDIEFVRLLADEQVFNEGTSDAP
jgi:anti-sigma factor RsiW